ncbi:MAG: hypothetical protein V8T45_09590 [Oscillospiraceae bacterium]
MALAALRREELLPYFLRFKDSQDIQMRQAAIMAIQKLRKAAGKQGGNWSQ